MEEGTYRLNIGVLREAEEGAIGEEVECRMSGGSGAVPDDGCEVSLSDHSYICSN